MYCLSCTFCFSVAFLFPAPFVSLSLLFFMHFLFLCRFSFSCTFCFFVAFLFHAPFISMSRFFFMHLLFLCRFSFSCTFCFFICDFSLFLFQISYLLIAWRMCLPANPLPCWHPHSLMWLNWTHLCITSLFDLVNLLIVLIAFVTFSYYFCDIQIMI